MTRTAVLTDEMWARIEPVLPPVKGAMGWPMRDHRSLVEGAVYRFGPVSPGRDLPDEFGPWQTVWKRHHRFSPDGTWGQGAGRVGGAGRRRRGDRLAGVGRFHDRAGASARCDRCEVAADADVAHRGARSNDKDPGRRRDEPDDYAIGPEAG